MKLFGRTLVNPFTGVIDRKSHARHAILLLGLLGITLGGSPAGAQLRFRSNSLHATLWRRIYSQLPAGWKARRLVYIREISDADMDRFVERFEGTNSRSDSIVDGCYQGDGDHEQTEGHITLRSSLQGENAALVFVHEYGHYVWSNLLTSADRARYRRIWREQKKTGNLVTDYAGENEEEGFAEAFSYFIRKPICLRRYDSRSWDFLDALNSAADDELLENAPP